MRKEIETRIKAYVDTPIDSTLLDGARDAVYNLMKSDTFVRFSTYYTREDVFSREDSFSTVSV